MSGLTDATKTLSLGYNSVEVMQTYAGLVDVIGVTYYPIDGVFAVKSPTVVAADFASLASRYSKPIHIQEIGYPTASATKSTEALQAEFFCEAFHAWDSYSTKITQMAALRMNDLSRAQAESSASPYGVSAEAFIEYLRSLGIRTYGGVDKAAYSIVGKELVKRGF